MGENTNEKYYTIASLNDLGEKFNAEGRKNLRLDKDMLFGSDVVQGTANVLRGLLNREQEWKIITALRIRLAILGIHPDKVLLHDDRILGTVLNEWFLEEESPA